MSGFSKAVHEFTVKAKKNTDVILRESVDALFDEVTKGKQSGGNLPQDTGNLGRSAAVSKTAMPRVDTVTKEYDEVDYRPVIFSADAGDTLFIGFQASYGPRMEYGFVGEDALGRYYNQAGNFFVTRAGEKWPHIVKQMEAKFGE